MLRDRDSDVRLKLFVHDVNKSTFNTYKYNPITLLHVSTPCHHQEGAPQDLIKIIEI